MVPVTHVIFDLDGVLIDSETITNEIYKLIFTKYGRVFTPEMRRAITGRPANFSFKFMIEQEGLTDKLTPQQFEHQFNELSDKMLSDCPIFKGAMRLVKHLVKHGIPLAICTSSDKIEFDCKMAKHKELTDLIPLVVLAACDPEVKQGKPAPDPYLVTARRFKVKPRSSANVLVFEDSENGVLSAVAAGMQVVMVPDLTYMKVPVQVKDKIALILESLEEFKPQSLGLPAYDD